MPVYSCITSHRISSHIACRIARRPLGADWHQNLEQSEIEKIVAQIEAEKEAEAERKRQRVAQTQAGQASMAMGSSAVSGSQTPGAGAAGAGVGDAQDMGRESGVQ
jgi:20S proteasome subunit alpha 4